MLDVGVVFRYEGGVVDAKLQEFLSRLFLA